jgi:hypothetical protein
MIQFPRWRRPHVGSLHLGVDVAVVPHVHDRTSANGKEEADAQAKQQRKVERRARAQIAGDACGKKKTCLQRFDERPVQAEFVGH